MVKTTFFRLPWKRANSLIVASGCIASSEASHIYVGVNPNVIIRQGKQLNRQLVTQELSPLLELKQEPEIMDQLKKLFEQYPN